MTEFATVVESWRDFFTLAGSASATLLGLLFVGISFRSDIRKQPEKSAMRAVVALNFLSYLIVILFSLYFMIPDLTPSELAWSIIITALVALSSVLQTTMRHRGLFLTEQQTAFWNFVVPTGCYLAAVGVGIAILLNDDGTIGWMVSVVAFLLIIPTRNAWELVMTSTETG
jgi:hypothetical protein